VTDETESIFTSLRDTIKNSFLPSMSSLELDDTEKSLMCKLTRLNGMGIDDPVQISKLFYLTSKEATSQLTQVIKEGGSIDISAMRHFTKRQRTHIEMNSLNKQPMMLIPCFLC